MMRQTSTSESATLINELRLLIISWRESTCESNDLPLLCKISTVCLEVLSA